MMVTRHVARAESTAVAVCVFSISALLTVDGSKPGWVVGERHASVPLDRSLPCRLPCLAFDGRCCDKMISIDRTRGIRCQARARSDRRLSGPERVMTRPGLLETQSTERDSIITRDQKRTTGWGGGSSVEGWDERPKSEPTVASPLAGQAIVGSVLDEV